MVKTGARDRSDPTIHWDKFFPGRNNNEKLEILVAGCGTYQAAIIAAKNKNSMITGIDISENSVAIQKNMVEKEGIKNINLQVSSIMEFDYEKKFDLIICSGVLHHLENPNENLKHLGQLVKEDGVVTVMVYNFFGRQGVYNIQAIVKLLDLPHDIHGARKLSMIIDSLPQTHSVNNYIKNNKELFYLENFMDTFFNPHDVCYTALEIPKLIQNTGLIFDDWLEMNYDEKIDFNLNKFEKAFYLDTVRENNGILSFILRRQK
jgi:2-polyprenyl-3-methyl-5-hydroxy-6-metoxy-1,4-benzoquinol methylase